MRTIRSNFYQNDDSSCSFTSSVPQRSGCVSENLTESVIDMRLGQLASKSNAKSVKSDSETEGFLDISQAFSDFSACSSDISGELQRLATLPSLENALVNESGNGAVCEPEPCQGFLQRENFSTEIIESISPEDLQPTVKICIDGLQSPSIAVKRSAAAKLRLLAKNRVDNRELIGESGAIPALTSLLRNTDPWTQEHAVTALLNLSLFEANKDRIINAGAIKSLVYVLKTGTETSKQNAAGKKDALTTLYKLCSARQNKERAVSAGAVRPLVGMVGEQGTGMEEKAMVVLSSLAGIEEGREAIVEEGGIAALVEAIEDGSTKGKEFAVLTLLQLCADSIRNRGLLVREGGIPPLVALSQTGSAKAKHKVILVDV
ncbi:hypothetical protein Golax_008086 [Gossypium laxum]|uniref:U-box domain-containing protein n=1 Tax=Gossypium laxum TaxID=34288 RepID=A0A7J9A8S0_9ROSI|nr:hypothetical protein [Gossypium laxum]